MTSPSADDDVTPAPPSRLTDADTGRWLITTEASVYLLDLDARQVVRYPGHGAGSTDPGQRAIVVLGYRTDGRPFDVEAVLACEIGVEMELSVRSTDGLTGLIRSTIVCDMQALHGPPNDASRDQ